jgi:hypothetical protein
MFRDKVGEVYVTWKMNNETINVGNQCVNGDCPVKAFVKFLKSRMIVGDVGKICRGEQEPWPQGKPLVKHAGVQSSKFMTFLVLVGITALVAGGVYLKRK